MPKQAGELMRKKVEPLPIGNINLNYNSLKECIWCVTLTFA